MQNRTLFITGGARSGKSAFAERISAERPGKRAYLATAQALDAEMVARIEHHRKRRGDAWDTFEEPLAVAELIDKLNGRYEVLLLDCLTLWLSNVIARHDDDRSISTLVESLSLAVRRFPGTAIVVSNEVGLGIVPDNALARRFRDIAGFANQLLAQAADEVFFLAAGIPVKIK
jgi:adenosylcobinamide kinase/adenosylcobinamide-phosphate guanylyltransferase